MPSDVKGPRKGPWRLKDGWVCDRHDRPFMDVSGLDPADAKLIASAAELRTLIEKLAETEGESAPDYATRSARDEVWKELRWVLGKPW